MKRTVGLSPGALLLALALGACDIPTGVADDVPDRPIVERRPADPILGLKAFQSDCAGCHVADDAFDLAFFSFPDSAIIRRALGHVDTTTAHDIVAYVHTLEVSSVDRFARSFQPGGVRLRSDVDFALELFGADEWPSWLTTEALAAIDPVDVPVALSFPRWSFEGNNLDWMPDAPFPDALLHEDDARAQRALDAYRQSGSEETLVDAVLALQSAERDPSKVSAPCLVLDPRRFQPEACFQARRWIAALGSQHMFRAGRSDPIDPSLHDAWWDVGDAARESIQHGAPIQNAEENWAVWMYLGWAFAPDRHSSVYLAMGFARIGLPRHAAFHALRSQVARVALRGDVYKDLSTAVGFAPEAWLFDVATFGYQHLIDRLESGDVPVDTPLYDVPVSIWDSHLSMAWEALEHTRWILVQRLGAERYAELAPLHARVEALLPPM